MRYSLMEFLAYYVIILFDENCDIHFENLRIITKLLNKWNVLNKENIHQNPEETTFLDDPIEEIISLEEEDTQKKLEEYNDESSETNKDNNTNIETNDMETEETNSEEITEDFENEEESNEMEFEESNDVEYEDPSSIHRVTEGINNYWSFHFQEDHSSLKDLNGFNF
ncbi:hypothetical protein EDI_048370 [Entamoeba dispar SAW760]|uniref:Uncharacterized protein n=1 Tax=Entamoeba dispar (strain ATCC PRA-260 / SAW760) TaxID=370354 RepID=B0EUM4_ENTDS|nr:uncharacterized protein EDI_048370 [Entamoeba dispar SAW760]EDR21773.1 hypothetical protein EDI_048370 [Entamoeba dispar SAW760]|eukprot:EDR21773.1 hypothetical protein EDI_048370 [Entamoeba dispar SAW760]